MYEKDEGFPFPGTVRDLCGVVELLALNLAGAFFLLDLTFSFIADLVVLPFYLGQF